jgi:hypothetical protein
METDDDEVIPLKGEVKYKEHENHFDRILDEIYNGINQSLDVF